ncbi:hypothetical protein M406DRAFT_343133 [Cryphonectria parasitica EP155]|uniref:Uncharacterized protein n=1 Tax=Cryphonectria parasitica (strain ATCC 38755 / EP155) TaxID=660469 RepID=A0A9P5CJF1_CRYP1|nr:uncharacterized protein M406DRAFT_343133 [Cryphonectria parasitica EP155]KAF3760998.1 hypothetical protein M406DRAFT_343133 [Cryphonectria parasitica EP155]
MAEATTGRRMLSQVEETNLDEVRYCIRFAFAADLAPTSNSHALSAPLVAKVKTYPIQDLDKLVTRHHRVTRSARLALTGRQLPLIYLLVATLITPPHNKAVVVVDTDNKFDITSVLQCAPHGSPLARSRALRQGAFAQQYNEDDRSPGPHRDNVSHTNGGNVTLEDLKHVHVYRTARGSISHVRDVLNSAEHYMIYSNHASATREWWGTIVIGGGGSSSSSSSSPAPVGSGQADVTTGRNGWLRVNRKVPRRFPVGMSIEEALVERDQRRRAADAAGFKATCIWGSLTFNQ